MASRVRQNSPQKSDPRNDSATFPAPAYLTAINCSSAFGATAVRVHDALQVATDAGFERVEFWWPFSVEIPKDTEIDAFIQVLGDFGVQLIAMNLYGGDMAAGERGVLHTRSLANVHLQAIDYIGEQTGMKFCNTLLGRGGRELEQEQLDRLCGIAEQLRVVKPLIEPLSGLTDYAVTTLREARRVADLTGAGLLLDLYHLAANGELSINDSMKELLGCADSQVLPDHVQLADVPGRGAPGTGELPLRRWASELRDFGYTGDIVGEWVAR